MIEETGIKRYWLRNSSISIIVFITAGCSAIPPEINYEIQNGIYKDPVIEDYENRIEKLRKSKTKIIKVPVIKKIKVPVEKRVEVPVIKTKIIEKKIFIHEPNNIDLSSDKLSNKYA